MTIDQALEWANSSINARWRIVAAENGGETSGTMYSVMEAECLSVLAEAVASYRDELAEARREQVHMREHADQLAKAVEQGRERWLDLHVWSERSDGDDHLTASAAQQLRDKMRKLEGEG